MSEKKDERESAEEQKLIRAIEVYGLGAKHMNTTVDGFPDIFIIGETPALVEMKEAAGFSVALYSVMETSQPVFIHKARGYGLRNIYLCVATKKEWRLFSTENLLELTVAGARIDELELLAASGNEEGIAKYLASRCGKVVLV